MEIHYTHKKKMSSVRGLRIPESKDFNSDFKGG